MIKTIYRFCFLFLLSTLVACQTVPTPSQVYAGQSDERIFRAAEVYLAKRDYSNSVKAFEALDSLYPFGPHASQAQLDMILAYYMAEDYVSAAAAAERYTKLYPRAEHVDYAFYMKGLANFHQEYGFLPKVLPICVTERDHANARQSYEDFSQLLSLFPTSPFVPDARLHMIYLRNHFARKELVIAKFYFARRAYVAAANRANYIVQHFPTSTSTCEALEVMIESYRALGLNQSADDALRILRANKR